MVLPKDPISVLYQWGAYYTPSICGLGYIDKKKAVKFYVKEHSRCTSKHEVYRSSVAENFRVQVTFFNFLT